MKSADLCSSFTKLICWCKFVFKKKKKDFLNQIPTHVILLSVAIVQLMGAGVLCFAQAFLMGSS